MRCRLGSESPVETATQPRRPCLGSCDTYECVESGVPEFTCRTSPTNQRFAGSFVGLALRTRGGDQVEREKCQDAHSEQQNGRHVNPQPPRAVNPFIETASNPIDRTAFDFSHGSLPNTEIASQTFRDIRREVRCGRALAVDGVLAERWVEEVIRPTPREKPHIHCNRSFSRQPNRMHYILTTRK